MNNQIDPRGLPTVCFSLVCSSDMSPVISSTEPQLSSSGSAVWIGELCIARYVLFRHEPMLVGWVNISVGFVILTSTSLSFLFYCILYHFITFWPRVYCNSYFVFSLTQANTLISDPYTEATNCP